MQQSQLHQVQQQLNSHQTAQLPLSLPAQAFQPLQPCRWQQELSPAAQLVVMHLCHKAKDHSQQQQQQRWSMRSGSCYSVPQLLLLPPKPLPAALPVHRRGSWQTWQQRWGAVDGRSGN